MTALFITSDEILGRKYWADELVKLHACGTLFEIPPFTPFPVSEATGRLIIKFAQKYGVPVEFYDPKKHNAMQAKALGRQATTLSLLRLEPYRKLTREDVKAAPPEQLAEIAVAAGYAPNQEAAGRLSVPARKEIALAALGFIGAKEPATPKE